ncbi:cell wall-associated NlpC family hydrolase [Spinactinospora alkalitolerans]|uniref:Cell wall-associated NlpC family hydrolase n=1 Tax=Spinactinospora alkalitolerans TaxID=687207 RepID=A0A852TUK6_9ACTN|nr:C40 family peptidase [Spinactinospora alkalitolerans]NYE46987.1 cell wall-associated NlpC family hydrolase [Spinactinospora alkalitolerans]
MNLRSRDENGHLRRRLPAAALCVLATSGTLGLLSATPAHAATDVTEEAVDNAESKIGTPYSYGAEGPDAFDCSGLVQWAYGEAGVELPRTTYDQVDAGEKVSTSDLEVGDLLFFYNGPSHVGIYVGDDQMVHAPNSDSSVETVDLSGYYEDNMTSAVRVA